MSYKKTSKPVFSNGKNRDYDDWHRSDKSVRNRVRSDMRTLANNPDMYDEYIDTDVEESYYFFNKRPAIILRWLQSKIGNSWDDVYAEACKKFNIRGTDGIHATHDILIKLINWNYHGEGNFANFNLNSGAGRYNKKYYIDMHGKLQQLPKITKGVRISDYESEHFSNFLNGRMVAEFSGKLYWVCPTEGEWRVVLSRNFSNRIVSLDYYILKSDKIPKSYYDDYKEYILERDGWSWILIRDPFSFRRRGELSVNENKIFYLYNKELQDLVLQAGHPYRS